MICFVESFNCLSLDTDHHATSPLFFIEDHLPAEQQYCEQSQELRTAEELSANCPAHSEYYPLIVPKKKGECIVNVSIFELLIAMLNS